MMSLRQGLIRVVILSGLLIAGVVASVAIFFYFAQDKWNFDQVTSRLESSVPLQTKDLVASFLIPEQSAGRDLLLKKYIAEEGLAFASVVMPGESLPTHFSSCQKSNRGNHCRSIDGKRAASLTPISQSNIIFGYLFKEKELGDLNGSWIFHYVGVAFLSLILVMATIIMFILRAYSKVARSLDSLQEWTGKVVMGDEFADSPEVQFKEFKLLGENIKRLIDEGGKLKRQAVGSEIARLVAHDIRAPVTALSVMIENIKGSEISELNKKSVLSSARRINDIAESLLSKKWNEVSGTRSAFVHGSIQLSSAIEAIVLEKRIQFRNRPGITIDLDIEGGRHIIARLNTTEIQRVFSNLVDNAVEAIPDAGSVLIRLTSNGRFASIEITDSGSGIPQEIMNQLGEKGVTHGRKNGSGLGVYHALKTIRAFGGDMTFESKEGKGTSVKILLPQVVTAMSGPLFTKSVSQIIIVDDDPTIHRTWDLRFSDAKEASADVLHFYTFDEAKRWFQRARPFEDRLFLVDFELSKTGPSGLDLIEELGISRGSILVTSRWDDPLVKSRAASLGVRILDKSQAGQATLGQTTIGGAVGTA